MSTESSRGLELDTLMKIKLNKPVVRIIDYEGCYRANQILWEYIELDDALHWLSTLGGAFSNLGEHNQEFAMKAGENALKQLAVAQRFGDKTVIAKCWLFVAMSCMQQRDFYKARWIIRNIYKQTKAPGMKDLLGTSKIVTICRGIWARLIYEINKHKERSEQQLEVECKFSVPENCRDRLQRAGAEKVGTVLLQDVYIDKQDYQLSRNDSWLRFRDRGVELKYAVQCLNHTEGSTVYREEKNRMYICEQLGCEIPSSVSCLGAEWTVLVSIQTSREKWRFEGLEIVLDQLEDGFTVGEIELVTNHPSQVDEARRRINRVAEELGFTRQYQGKLDHALRLHNPAAFSILVGLHQQKYKNDK